MSQTSRGHTGVVDSSVPDDLDLRSRFAASPVARLATVRTDGWPHLVPVVFALVGDLIFTAVDGKPKRTLHLQRLINIAAEPRCTVLVDHHEDDWSRLWWVRADGRATIVELEAAPRDAAASLQAKYPQYRRDPPPGPLIAIRVEKWTEWSAGQVSGAGT